MKFQLKSINARLFLYFFILIASGTTLLMMPFAKKPAAPTIHPVDAVFTTISAVCVTGLSTLDIAVFSDAGLVVLMCLIEAGGLGLMAFFALYLAFPGMKVSLVNRKFIRDYFIEGEDNNVWQILLRTIAATLLIQIIGAVLIAARLYRTGEPRFVFYGIFLAISSFCNAGFSPWSDSLLQFKTDFAMQTILGIQIILGGLGFTVFTNILLTMRAKITHRKKFLSLHTKIVLLMTFVLLFAGAAIILAADWNDAFKDLRVPQKIGAALFESATLRTAGFEAVPQSSFSGLSVLVSYLLMLIGGSPGSMAGGLKTTTVFLALCYTFRSSRDRGPVTIFKRDIAWETMEKALRLLIKSITLLLVMLAILCAVEKTNMDRNNFLLSDLFYEAFSAFGTVGLSRSVTPQLTFAGKIIVMLLMFAGRTGMFAMSIEVGKKSSLLSVTDYPKEDVLTG